MGNFFAARNGYLLVKRGKQRENWGRSECKEKACDKGLLYFLRGLLPMMLPKHHQDIGKVLGDLGDFEKKRFQTHVILDFFSTWESVRGERVWRACVESVCRERAWRACVESVREERA